MKPSSYPVLNNRPIDQWRVTELKEELKKRKLGTRGLKEELVRRLDESLRSEMDSPDQEEVESGSDDDSEPKGDADETTPIANESVSEAPKVDRGDDIVVSDAEDQADGKNIDVHDDSQPKGNADEMTSIANADEMTSIANADEMTPIANADEITPIVNADEITPVANESVSEAPKADKGVDIVVNDAEEQADGKNIDFLGDSQPKGNADEMTLIANADEITPVVNADEITPVAANESVSEAPKADKGVDIVVNDAEEQADGKNIDFLGDSQPKGNADEMTPIANESVSEAPKGVDIVVNDVEEQADGKNIDVLGDSQLKGNADEMTPIAVESVSEALDVDLVLKDEENQAVGKTLEVDNASSQAVDDDNGKISDENLGQQAGEMTHASPAVKDEEATDEKSVEMSIAASEVVSSVAAISGQGSENKQDQLDAEDIKPSDEEVNQNMSDLNNQVSEVSPSLGFPVKNDSNSTDSVSINKMNELKDNIIADDVKLESDVKHELVQPSSSPIVPDGGISCPMDVEEPQNKVSVDETKNSVKDEEMSKKISSADVGSPEKLNLDRSSCDDSMEEDTLENKQVDSTYISDEVGGRDEKTVVTMVKEEIRVDIMGDDLSAAKKDGHGEDMVGIAASTEKRKLPDDQEPVTNNEPFKRQRKWKTESVQASEPQCSSPALSTTPRGVPPAPGLKRSFSRSNSNADDEAPKERVVPPPSNPPTDSLRIDNFVRPFTLKAVQEFLGKTGTVTSFWMDHIKTHCYVTYSSVEEATETRNAVCNLQWPPNGGRLLAAEFVDAQEVKSHVDGPPQPPTPVAPANAPPAAPLLPSPRQLGPRQKQLLQTNLPPPPPLTNPPPVRERLQPPPPPPPEKVEPPVVTLDDLFRKTKMTPRIYYLPLSEEQVSAKLAAAQHRNSKP